MGVFLSCQGLSKSFGVRPMFEGLSFGLNEGERTGLIGPNGAGKSTLLRILAGQETADEGSVTPRRGLRVGCLAQTDRFELADEGWTVRDELTQALQGLGLEDYEIDMKVEDGIERAGFSSADQLVSKLSGGWRKRLAILSQVIREPDLLLLDEPTNHLDLEGVLWLEKFLLGLRFAFLTVTHDRRFLERVCNRIIELNKRYEGGHFSSAGNYSDFLEKREALFADQETRADALANTVRGEIAWLRKGPKARTTKQQARIDRAGEMIGELAELKYRNAQGRAADIDFTGSERQSKSLVRLIKAGKSMGGRRLFGPLDLILGPGDRLGLLGENGAGKSTLLKLLAGTLAPDSGEVRFADKLEVVTFDQHREQLDMSMTLKRALCGGAGEHVEYKGSRIHVYGWAARFLFRAEQLEYPLSRLSGGEQSRVLIARLMLKPADILLLDEPTNDLDLQSLEVLENSMKDFPGALVLVTHDRYLLDRVSKEILALDGKGGTNFYAELSQWEDSRERAPRDAGSSPGRASAPVKPALSSKEARELQKMEASIKSGEEDIAKAKQALEDPAIAADAAELGKRQERVVAAIKNVEELYKRWEELEARR
ncbi:MAG TPA: ABC-F family ATP-binding cassette domain-containing protein [Elusimicrobiota bacterium]|nr:ABC-F family ATP-binding cassette domain-containing protein [Elusimicrobiota bacterium]